MKAWLNKHWTHDRDPIGDFGFRAALHIPVGFMIGLFLLDRDMFLKYERNEDIHTEDEAWKDIYGALVGFPFGRASAIAVTVAAVIYIIYRIGG